MNRFPADIFGRRHFNVVKPDILVKSHFCGLPAHPADFSRSGVVGGKSEKHFVKIVHVLLVGKIVVIDEAQVFASGPDVVVNLFNIADVDFGVGGGTF